MRPWCRLGVESQERRISCSIAIVPAFAICLSFVALPRVWLATIKPIVLSRYQISTHDFEVSHSLIATMIPTPLPLGPLG